MPPPRGVTGPSVLCPALLEREAENAKRLERGRFFSLLIKYAIIGGDAVLCYSGGHGAGRGFYCECEEAESGAGGQAQFYFSYEGTFYKAQGAVD